MHSPLPAKPCDDPCDVVAVAPDAVGVAPSDEEPSDVLHQAARSRSDTKPWAPSESPDGRTAPPVDTAFRAAPVDDVLGSAGRSIAGRAARGVIALLLAACIGLAAVTWKSYGETAKRKIAKLATQFVVTSSLPSEESAPTVPPAVPDAASAEPAALVQTAPKSVAIAAEAPTADSAQLLQSTARDLLALTREVEQLKAGMEQLKVNQQQTLRDVAQSSEQKVRSRTSAPALRSADTRSRKPSFSTTQPAAAPPFRQAAEPYYVPRQPEPQPAWADPGVSSVPRPPMPVR
jgi:hypothetical protein